VLIQVIKCNFDASVFCKLSCHFYQSARQTIFFCCFSDCDYEQATETNIHTDHFFLFSFLIGLNRCTFSIVHFKVCFVVILNSCK